MSDKAGDKSTAPSLKDMAQGRAEDREQRRAAALRANLTRRKAQSRAREAAGQPAAEAPPKPDK